ncbi:hypothetical protein DFQ28_000829 [Apophysomyces sp. BC1034]|nr:hypothetical protein DFQ30_001400 [Apophysomyces sp. BC1015]KAG0183822.1 hypothetical protein DFQ28_000829 [Apophysomyces sp. BC1034]
MKAPRQPTVDYSLYEQPTTISNFEAILQSLQGDPDAEKSHADITASDLADFTAQLQQFQENELGHKAVEAARKEGRSIPSRIPAAFFRVEDLKSTSPLYIILKASYMFKSDRGISDWQFGLAELRDIHMDLVYYLKEQLVDAGLQRIPCIAFDTAAEHRKKEYASMIDSMGGNVTDDLSQATHIIHNEKAEHGKDSFHVLERKDAKMLVHWIGLPDSYNSWIDNDESQDTVVNNIESFPFNVKANWVTDSYKYNEWMAVADYLCTSESLAKTSLKRAVETSLHDESSPSKRSKIQLDDNSDELHSNRQEEARKYLSVQMHEIIIPSYAAWFDVTKIHHIERRALPEFFNNRNRSKTPSVYKEYRDFMVNTYRLNPLEYLTVTACRRNMTGDVCTIIRVHAFLEQWGLINYQVDPAMKLSNVGPPFDGQVKIIADMPRGLQVINKSSVTSTSTSNSISLVTEKEYVQPATNREEHVSDKPKRRLNRNLRLRRDIYDNTSNDHLLMDTKVPPKCATCGNECTEERYHNTKANHIFFCNACYDSQKFPAGCNSDDIVKDTKRDSWTEQETMLVLEGLEMYAEDWDAVAGHVGTRTRDECILHYLQLPFEDPHVDEEVAKLGLLQFNAPQPSENTVMSVVAYLASGVRPEVAAAAGQQSPRQPLETLEEKTLGEEEKEDDDYEVHELESKLLRAKLSQFKLKAEQYKRIEMFVEEERRQLEKQRHQLSLDRLVIKRKVGLIYQEMAKKGVLANSITPAQIQQHMASGALQQYPNNTLPPEQQQQQQGPPSSNHNITLIQPQ